MSSIVIQLLWCCHAHSQLSLSLLRLKLLCLYSITESVFLCSQCLEPQLLLCTNSLAAIPLRSPARWPRARTTSAVAAKSTVIQIALGYEGLLATLEFIYVVLYALEKIVDFWANFREET